MCCKVSRKCILYCHVRSTSEAAWEKPCSLQLPQICMATICEQTSFPSTFKCGHAAGATCGLVRGNAFDGGPMLLLSHALLKNLSSAGDGRSSNARGTTSLGGMKLPPTSLPSTPKHTYMDGGRAAACVLWLVAQRLSGHRVLWARNFVQSRLSSVFGVNTQVPVRAHGSLPFMAELCRPFETLHCILHQTYIKPMSGMAADEPCCFRTGFAHASNLAFTQLSFYD